MSMIQEREEKIGNRVSKCSQRTNGTTDTYFDRKKFQLFDVSRSTAQKTHWKQNRTNRN